MSNRLAAAGGFGFGILGHGRFRAKNAKVAKEKDFFLRFS